MKTRRAAYLFNSFTFLAADWIWLDWRRNPPIKMQQVPPVEAYRSGGTGLFVVCCAFSTASSYDKDFTIQLVCTATHSSVKLHLHSTILFLYANNR